MEEAFFIQVHHFFEDQDCYLMAKKEETVELMALEIVACFVD